MTTLAETSVESDSTFDVIIAELQSGIETFDTDGHRSPVASIKSFKENHPKPKRKRIRREKVELDQLRLEAHQLQTELDQLQVIHNGETITRKRHAPNLKTMRGYQTIAPRDKATGSVWQDIATNQLNERLRAQTTNRELRDQLQAEFCLGRQMMALLHRKSKPVVPLKVLNDQRKLPHDEAEAIFRDQLVQAEDSLLEMEKILLRPAFQDPTACFVNTFLQKCDGHKFFVMESNMTLPFTAQVAANAVWNVMGTDKIKDHCYSHHFVHQSDTVLAQTFGIHFTTDASDADFRGNYTLCRFNESCRIVIVWVALYKPVELNGLEYNGVQCQQLGWMEFSNHACGNSALVRSYSRLSVIADGTIEKKELQMRSLFILAQQMHEQVGGLVSSHLQKELIEEDWKTHEWENNLVIPKSD